MAGYNPEPFPWDHIGVRPHKEKINISKEIINKTRGAVAPYAAQIFTHLSVVSSRQRSYDRLRCKEVTLGRGKGWFSSVEAWKRFLWRTVYAKKDVKNEARRKRKKCMICHQSSMLFIHHMLFCHRMNRIIYKRTLGSDPLKYFKLFILTKLVLRRYK